MDVTRTTRGSHLLGALALTVVGAAAAEAATGPPTTIRAYKPEADTYVSAAQPGRNFGGTRSLRADGAPQATVYLRFRIEKLQGEVESVTLLLHAEAGGRSFEVRRVRQKTWRERTLTFENAPRLSLRYASSKPIRRGRWSAVDVTPLVDHEGDDRLVSLAVTTKSPFGVVFASRESSEAPRLVVTTKRDRSDGDRPGGPPGKQRQARLPAP